MRPSPDFSLHRTNEMIVGGTALIDEFFGILGETRRPCQLMIASAFITPPVIERFSRLNHRMITLQIAARSRTSFAAAKGIAVGFPWKSSEARSSRALHAKVFAFLRDDMSGAFVIGSHNLTRAGTGSNMEVGVLYRTERAQTCACPLLAAMEQFRHLWLNSFPLSPNL